MIDRQTTFSGMTASDLPATTLEPYLTKHIQDFTGPLRLFRFKGGQSNPSYRIETPAATYVLRRKPFGTLLASAHAIEREYRVTLALHGAGFPVAKPLHLCTDEAIIGSPFFIMEHVSGRIFWEPHAPGLSGNARAALFDEIGSTIARLHGLDIAELGLADFGKPHGYIARQIKRWSDQYRASETEQIVEMDQLIGWLPGACPADSGASLVHGDFRLDNCIIHQSEPRILAVLDWELSTVGDPLADFAYHLMQWHMPVSESGAGVGSLLDHAHEPGLPSIESYIQRYCQLTGRTMIADLDIYLAYNFFRLAAIFQGILGRVRAGTAASTAAEAMAGQVRPLAQTAWKFARRAGA
ncbi:phosphotransferase family protein [Aestuariivirga sp.]|jgi:aminoglycoside phosphotransferase (APT) family kinase protein|uniref:phosphotransferase family protein n=1 Tax=Aestuariivirga sp. TaxID=2650926 RepID=UPI00378356B3